ncbi:hypothetical protein H311_03899 [Anncaliia algerae PRA109]|nr:hypothetical protein H311_03899 [Anncaliia algerae PRA109]
MIVYYGGFINIKRNTSLVKYNVDISSKVKYKIFNDKIHIRFIDNCLETSILRINYYEEVTEEDNDDLILNSVEFSGFNIKVKRDKITSFNFYEIKNIFKEFKYKIEKNILFIEWLFNETNNLNFSSKDFSIENVEFTMINFLTTNEKIQIEFQLHNIKVKDIIFVLSNNFLLIRKKFGNICKRSI